MGQLGQQDCPEVDGPINGIDLPVSPIEVVEVGVDDEILGGDGEPVEVWGGVVGEGLLGNQEGGEVAELLELVGGAGLVVGDVQYRGEQQAEQYGEHQ